MQQPVLVAEIGQLDTAPIFQYLMDLINFMATWIILKISDSSGDYDFEIKGITKEKNDISRRGFSYKKEVELTPKQLSDFWKKYKK